MPGLADRSDDSDSDWSEEDEEENPQKVMLLTLLTMGWRAALSARASPPRLRRERRTHASSRG